MSPAIRPNPARCLFLYRRNGRTFDGTGRIYSDAEIERAERQGKTVSLKTAPAWLASPKAC